MKWSRCQLEKVTQQRRLKCRKNRTGRSFEHLSRQPTDSKLVGKRRWNDCHRWWRHDATRRPKKLWPRLLCHHTGRWCTVMRREVITITILRPRNQGGNDPRRAFFYQASQMEVELPLRSSRSKFTTQLPPGWDKQDDGQGRRYYSNMIRKLRRGRHQKDRRVVWTIYICCINLNFTNMYVLNTWHVYQYFTHLALNYCTKSSNTNYSWTALRLLFAGPRSLTELYMQTKHPLINPRPVLGSLVQ